MQDLHEDTWEHRKETTKGFYMIEGLLRELFTCKKSKDNSFFEIEDDHEDSVIEDAAEAHQGMPNAIPTVEDVINTDPMVEDPLIGHD